MTMDVKKTVVITVSGEELEYLRGVLSWAIRDLEAKMRTGSEYWGEAHKARAIYAVADRLLESL